MSSETIARRYSAALADTVLQHGEAETVRTEVAEIGRLFEENGDLRTIFANPAIAHANKVKVLNGLLDKLKPTKTTANFLKVLLHNGRLAEIGAINERFTNVLEERSGGVTAEVTSAREMPQPERAAVEQNLEKLTKKRVTVNYRVDPEIIGGVVTRIGSTVYDGSVKTKLENLKEQLVNG